MQLTTPRSVRAVSRRRRQIQHLSTCVIIMLLVSLLTACTPVSAPSTGQTQPTATFEVSEANPGLENAPPALPLQKPDACPALASQLYQITQASEPVAMAETLGVRVVDGKVQVLIVLAGDDATFLAAFGIVPGTVSANQVQAFAPIDQLCALANHESVVAVRPAAMAQP